MNIKYFEVDYHRGRGSILERSIDTSNQNYISHSKDKIVLRDTCIDRHGEILEMTQTFHINFKDACAELISHYKKMIDELQKEINLLQEQSRI